MTNIQVGWGEKEVRRRRSKNKTFTIISRWSFNKSDSNLNVNSFRVCVTCTITRMHQPRFVDSMKMLIWANTVYVDLATLVAYCVCVYDLLVLCVLLCVRCRSENLCLMCDCVFWPVFIIFIASVIVLWECEFWVLFWIVCFILISVEWWQWFIDVDASIRLWSIVDCSMCDSLRCCPFSDQSQFIRVAIGQCDFHEFSNDIFVDVGSGVVLLDHVRDVNDDRRPILTRKYVGITFWQRDSKSMGDLFMIVLLLSFWHIISNLFTIFILFSVVLLSLSLLTLFSQWFYRLFLYFKFSSFNFNNFFPHTIYEMRVGTFEFLYVCARANMCVHMLYYHERRIQLNCKEFR